MPDDITPDDIAGAVMEMFGTLRALQIVSTMKRVPFADNIERAVERFDKPELRGEMVRLLYAEET